MAKGRNVQEFGWIAKYDRKGKAEALKHESESTLSRLRHSHSVSDRDTDFSKDNYQNCDFCNEWKQLAMITAL